VSDIDHLLTSVALVDMRGDSRVDYTWIRDQSHFWQVFQAVGQALGIVSLQMFGRLPQNCGTMKREGEPRT
jgi:hypothetical protein